jgi:hypothetical protein
MEIIYDGIHEWEGWGSALRLGSGKCRLRLFTLKSDTAKGLISLKSTVAVVSDLPDSPLSVRSCAPHISASIAEKFNIDIRRVMYVEYYPESSYGQKKERTLPARYDVADFTWHKKNAPEIKWHSLNADVLEIVEKYINTAP